MTATKTLYLGRLQQGQELPLTLQTTTAAGAPGLPLAYPWLSIYQDGVSPTLVGQWQVAADQQGVQSGLFRLPLFLGLPFSAPGRYLAVLRWRDANNVARVKTVFFYLLPGGSADGTVISLFYTEQAQAKFLLWQTDGGNLVRGQNPR